MSGLKETIFKTFLMKPFSKDKIKRKGVTNKLRAINECKTIYVNNI